MTRLVTTGWETGDINENQTSSTTPANFSVGTSAPAPRAGTYYLKSTGTANAKLWTMAAAKTDLWVRCGYYLNSPASDVPLISFLDSAGTAQCTVRWDQATTYLQLRLSTAGAVLATSTIPMSNQVWHTVEARLSVTSTTVGVAEVWLDGTQVINFSGDCVATANANVQSVQIQLGATSGTGYLDDLAINDTAGSVNNGRPGDGRIVMLSPTGAGSSTVLARAGTDTGANYSQVNELPPSMTQYVQSSVAADRDLYAMGNMPGSGVGTINCAEAIGYGLVSDYGGGSIGLTVKSGATTNEATAAPLAISAIYVRQLYETDPNTSTAWTSTTLNAVEAGVTAR